MRILALLSLFMITQLNAQDAEERFAKAKTFQVNIKLKPGTTAKLPFSRFEITDKRFDTSKLGYRMRKNLSLMKIVTKGSFVAEVENELNELMKSSLDDKSGSRLHVFVKHFWTNETNPAEAANNKIDEDFVGQFLSTTITLECFLEKETVYFPVLRYDTVILNRIANKRHIDDELSAAIQSFISHLATIDWNKPRKKMTETEVLSYTERFFIPERKPVTESGIYLTFNDFKKGNLQKMLIEVRFDRTDELYIFRNGRKELLTNFWGFSDGGVEYINAGLNFFQLVKAGNTYEVIGKKNLIKYTASSEGTYSEVWVRNKPWQLNMETGQLY